MTEEKLEVISRKEATDLGFKFYFTGKPCKRGHTSQRYVSTGACIACNKVSTEAWYKENRDKAIEASKKWYEENTERKKESAREWYESNREHKLGKNKEWKEANSGRVSELNSLWHMNNRERRLAEAKARREAGKEQFAEYRMKRYHTDPDYKMNLWMRTVLRRTLKGEAKESTTLELLGYTHRQLRSHIEGQFEVGMCWENHGSVWHIDHIMPINHFIKSGETDPSVVNSLDNLRPLWADENMSKGAKYEPNG